MPKEFAKFLQLIKDQLFFNTDDYIVVLDQLEWERRRLSKIDIMQGIEHLQSNGVAVEMRIYNDVWYGAGIPATTKGREAMLKGALAALTKYWFAGFGAKKFKTQIVLKIDKKFNDFHERLTGYAKKVAIAPPSSKPELSFDIESSVLMLNGEKIRIQQKNDKPNAHYVLEFIFENPEGLRAENFYSDILSSKFNSNYNDDDKDNWRKCYRACEDVQDKVMKQTKLRIPSFLIFNSGITGSVKINPRFIPK